LGWARRYVVLERTEQVVKIETVEKSAWEGVAQIDRAGDAASDPGYVLSVRAAADRMVRCLWR
jgi:hypothetical protein